MKAAHDRAKTDYRSGQQPRSRRPNPGESEEVFTIPADSLLPGDSPRLKGEDTQHIQILAESEMPLPPITVHRGTMHIIDGGHRLRATLMRGQETIQVQFFDGSEADAFVYAVQANTQHGLPLSLADRRAAAARIIASHPQCSNRWIATITGLASGTVAAIRRRTCAGDEQVTARIGRDGRIRPLSSADGRRIAQDAITANPEASLREIARLAGLSPATVRDVRERMRRCEDPLSSRTSTGPERPTPVGSPSSSRARAYPAALRSRISLLQSLSRDPSLRFSESGRALLRWLDMWAKGPDHWADLIDAVPPHCAYLIADLVRSCADDWLRFAAQLEQRLRARA